MKKLVTVVAAAALLGGCGLYKETPNEDEKTEEAADQQQTEVTFSLQESNRFAQVSALNDETLKLLSDRVAAGDEQAMGEEGEVSMLFSGTYLEAEDQLYGVFLITNRTDKAMTNLRYRMTMSESETEVPFVQEDIYLGSQAFGTLEPDTAMPVYVEMSTDLRGDLDSYDFGQAIVELSNLHYEQPEQAEGAEGEADNPFPDGFTPGYHPQYTLSVQHEQQLRQDIEDGNVPELELVIPPVIQNNPQSAEIKELLTDKLLNPAKGLSIEEDMTLHWTGVTAEDPDGSLSTLFLVTNRTGQDKENFSLTMNFSDSEGEPILEAHELQFSAEEYGVLPDQGLMPVFVEIPSDRASVLTNILDGHADPDYSIVSFQ